MSNIFLVKGQTDRSVYRRSINVCLVLLFVPCLVFKCRPSSFGWVRREKERGEPPAIKSSFIYISRRGPWERESRERERVTVYRPPPPRLQQAPTGGWIGTYEKHLIICLCVRCCIMRCPIVRRSSIPSRKSQPGCNPIHPSPPAHTHKKGTRLSFAFLQREEAAQQEEANTNKKGNTYRPILAESLPPQPSFSYTS